MVRIFKSHIEYIQDDLGTHVYVVYSGDTLYRTSNIQPDYIDEIYLDFGSIGEFRTIAGREDYECYIEYLIELLKVSEVPERQVVLACSMGKDSAAGFVILYELWNRGVLKHKPLAVFTYMPILEDIILKLADRFISKFAEFLHIIHVPKSEILDKLQTRGYPTLQEKWCRAIKMGSIKKFLKRFEKSKVAYAECERIFESIKRLRSLYGSRPVFPQKIQPVLYLTEADVFTICRMYGIVHGMYEYGAPRTSCALCPYASSTSHIVHIWMCEELGIDIEPLLRSFEKLLRYYQDIGFGDIVKTEMDIIKLGLYSYRHLPEEIKMKLEVFNRIIREGEPESILSYVNRSRRYFFEYLEKVRYFPIWRSGDFREAERVIREMAKSIVRRILQMYRV